MKTVLLLVHNDVGQEARLQAALDLTRALNGHLLCVDVTPLMTFAGDIGGVAQGVILAEARKIEAANRIAIEARLAQEQAPWDWIDATGDVAQCLIREAGLADLIVVNCKRERLLDVEPHAVVSDVVTQARCPVIAVPDPVRGVDVTGLVVVAWDGSPPVMATLRASTPLLKLAASVELLTVGDHEGVPTEAAAAYLSRHGVHAAIRRIPANCDRPDTQILEACAAAGAGYCLMGAYGHGRLKEELFGGVTRGMLDAARLPLLLGR
ncbi:MAG: universal stress protein UspA [Caulobacter sp. 12-67-6]|nr:MAG: universal stress protein UspA [Caulobacter sp. 12-67-6]OYX68159.1 MAG: universal stress protein UspA [Caulobacter sp. 32-67-35]OZA75619.1 MAG: universal stress protein UspA [Caulobacter sp. 39-67-4]HQR89303.1 universal stress protein [Caulobacter sp.]